MASTHPTSGANARVTREIKGVRKAQHATVLFYLGEITKWCGVKIVRVVVIISTLPLFQVLLLYSGNKAAEFRVVLSQGIIMVVVNCSS